MDKRIPDYYIGKNYKYEARKVVSDWELSYNVGNAVTYLLRLILSIIDLKNV